MNHLPHPGSRESQVTTAYSMSNGARSASTSNALSLNGQDTGRQSEQAGQLYGQGLSHSHTLPDVLSHHHSKYQHYAVQIIWDEPQPHSARWSISPS